MTNKLTPLKTLKSIEDFIYLISLDRNIRHADCPNTRIWVRRNFNFDIIETELKRLEEKEHNCEVYLKQINGLAFKLAKYKKEHKALEIIKEKNVNVRAFKKVLLMKHNDEFKLRIYNSQNHRHKDDITQEEYDLLKEVLK